MAQFLIKYSATSGVVPTSAELPIRQIAVNTADGKLFIKKNDGTILTFENSGAFAAAVHSHSISDVTGLQGALDTLTSAAAAAQSGADASLKSASNLSDLANASTARTNLGVDSSSEVDSKISTSKSASDAYTDAAIAALINGSPATLDTLKEIADALAAGSDVATALATSIAGVSSRVDTLEGQNLDSRLSTAESDIDTLQSDVVAAQSAADAAQSTADSAVTAAATAQSAAEAAQSTADSAVSAAATAQSTADASLKIASNLSDLADAATSRSNLGVDSSSQVDSKISTAVSSAQSTLQGSIDGVDARVTTLEGQNLDSRLSSAESAIDGLGTMSAQDSNNVSITGGSIGAGSVPTDSGVILTENSIIDGGTFSGFNGGGGGGGSTPWYVDGSSAARTVTLSGGVSSSDEGGGVKAALFNGSSGYLQVDTASSLNSVGADFTFEAFVYPTSNIGTRTIAALQAAGTYNTGLLLRNASNAYDILYAVNQYITLDPANNGLIPLNAWSHVAVTKSGNNVALFVNGTSVYTMSSSDTFDFSTMLIGSAANSIGSELFEGKLAGVRLVVGSALYTGGFYSVPTSVPTAITGTELLLNFEATAVPSV